MTPIYYVARAGVWAIVLVAFLLYADQTPSSREPDVSNFTKVADVIIPMIVVWVIGVFGIGKNLETATHLADEIKREQKGKQS